MDWQFIHIPKCGGLSFRKAYADFEGSLIQPDHNAASSLPPEVRTVAVLRHPLDRLVSAYAHAHGKVEGIREWIDSGRWQEWPFVVTRKRHGEPGSRQLPLSAPQVNWLRPETHCIIFEEYQSGLDAWAAMAGYPRRELEHRNKSTGRNNAHWSTVLRQDQQQMLWNFYRPDIERRRSIRRLMR